MPPEGRLDTVAEVLNGKFHELAELARRTLVKAVVSAGGLLIQNDGAFEVVTAGGVYVLYSRRGGDGKREFGIARDNGTYVIRTFATAGQQAWALHDNVNNILVADDGVSGVGLARPALHWPTRRIRYDSLPGVDAAGFEPVMDTGFVYKQHPRVHVQIVHCSSVSGTTGEVRLMLDGVQVGATQSVAFTVTYVDIGPFAIPGSHMSQHRLELQCRRTAGVGKVGAEMVVRSEQSP